MAYMPGSNCNLPCVLCWDVAAAGMLLPCSDVAALDAGMLESLIMPV